MPVLCMVLGYAAPVSEWGFESFGGRLWTARELDFRVPTFVRERGGYIHFCPFPFAKRSGMNLVEAAGEQVF